MTTAATATVVAVEARTTRRSRPAGENQGGWLFAPAAGTAGLDQSSQK
jgi:hypothetical protein